MQKMRVLVTGGTGVVGTATVRALVALGHEVRLFSRNAQHDVDRWPRGVEPRPGRIEDPDSVRGSMDDCDAVVHLAGIVAEEPPRRRSSASTSTGRATFSLKPSAPAWGVSSTSLR